MAEITAASLAVLNETGPGDAAARYAGLGWPVVPIAGMVGEDCGCQRRAGCEHPAKHPLTPGGISAASTNADQVAEWWSHWPWAGVGVATGSASGLVVVDVDPAHGGRDSLTQLRGAGAGLPRTVFAATGGGGWHLFYAHPGPENPVGNAIGRLGTRQLAGIDLRADGGYVVAAPSGHRSGGRYGWADTSDRLRALPSWIAERPEVAPIGPTLRAPTADRLATYAATALESECARVATAPESLRNHTLNRAAFSLGTLVGANALPEDTVVDHLVAAAAVASRAGETPLGDREVLRTIRSGLEAGRKRPRVLDEANSRPAPTPRRLSPTTEAPPTRPATSRGLRR